MSHKFNLNIIIIALLIFSIYNNIQLGNKLENTENNLQNNINNMYSRIGNIEGNVTNTLNKFSKENTWLSSANYSITGFDFENKKADLQFRVILNEINKDETVSAILSGKKEYKYELNREDGLNYSTNVELSSEYNYNVQLLAEGDNSIRSTHLFNLNLKDYINDLYIIEIMPIELRSNQNKSSYSFSLFVETMIPGKINFNIDSEELLIQDLYVESYNGNNLLETYGVIKNGEKNEDIFNNSSKATNKRERAVRESNLAEYESFEVFINDELEKKIEFDNLILKAYLTNKLGYTYEATFNVRNHEMNKTVVTE